MVIIEKSTQYPYKYKVKELIKFGITDFYKIYNTNKYIAIRKVRPVKTSGLTSVVIRETHKEPLYKQHMRMQMGQKLREIEDRRSYRLKQLNAEDVAHLMFEIYNTV